MTETKIDDGGPAFPWGEHGTHLGGMTIRDYFAGQALSGLIAEVGLRDMLDKEHQDAMAANAYTIADLLIAARSKAQGEPQS